MNTADIVSTIGVVCILLAFLGITFKILTQQHLIYWILNIVGGIGAAAGAYLLHSVPFIVLESIWAVSSVIGMVKLLKK